MNQWNAQEEWKGRDSFYKYEKRCNDLKKKKLDSSLISSSNSNSTQVLLGPPLQEYEAVLFNFYPTNQDLRDLFLKISANSFLSNDFGSTPLHFSTSFN